MKDYSLVIECTKEIVALYENIKTSKYNSAVQKFFITLKEIKIESLSNQTKDVYTRDNQQENRNFEKFGETSDSIEMIIENYKGILEYEDFFVKVSTHIGNININGFNLKLENMSEDNIKINGKIESLDIERKVD